MVSSERALVVKGERGSVAKTSVKKPSKLRATAQKAPPKSAAKSSVALKSKASSKLAPSKIANAKPAPSKVIAAASKAAAKIIVKKPEPVKTSINNSAKLAKPKKPENDHPQPVTVQAPVPTDGKPRKNQAGLSSKELEHFRELLLAKRRELVGDMSSMEREALRSASGSNLSNLPLHMADMGTDNYEQEFTLGLVEKDRGLLREINQALAKIQDGTYGLCEGTGKPISKARLEAQPWAKYSIEHARAMERTGMGIRRV